MNAARGDAFSAFQNRLLELLYPSRCPFCHRLLFRPEEKLCRSCRTALPYVPKAAQAQRFPFLKTCVSPLYYEKDVRASVLRYKFRGLCGYAEIYADFLIKCIDENQISCDSITWAPLSRRRLRRRGYDQARLLAEALARRMGLPCLPLLRKIRHTPPQSGTERAAERRANVSGAYAARPGAEIRGKHILLVDDVVTTGSTLSECARILKQAGAASVSAVTLARHKD